MIYENKHFYLKTKFHISQIPKENRTCQESLIQ